jgi:hypothetical protein
LRKAGSVIKGNFMHFPKDIFSEFKFHLFPKLDLKYISFSGP